MDYYQKHFIPILSVEDSHKEKSKKLHLKSESFIPILWVEDLTEMYIKTSATTYAFRAI